ncbi:hypothetical protein [Streptomyces armeniacus]|uniref:hypothetical protein n=1 Tax=Streptomyces armeniacus TaxID=83291 RepID=UPI001FE9D396|nr:hypothetical protein [Streptomyces armeniacus]
MSDEYLYTETSRNPFAWLVRLDDRNLRIGLRWIPLDELNFPAMADAYLRGGWLGGGGSERPLAHLGDARGIVPVTRISGSSMIVKPRRAADFARALGELAVLRSGGPEAVGRLASQARAVGVPLWIARRSAHGPHGPVTVAVDRRGVRVDVWAEGAPTVRIRAPQGVSLDRKNQTRNLEMTIGDEPAALTIDTSRLLSKNTVTVAAANRQWELRKHGRRGSQLVRDGQPVAVLKRPDRPTGHVPLLPLADVEYGSTDLVDDVVAHALAVSFGLGESTGTVRFGGQGELVQLGDPDLWGQPWFTGVGTGSQDSGPGAGGDGWGGGDGGGGDSGGDSGGYGSGQGAQAGTGERKCRRERGLVSRRESSTYRSATWKSGSYAGGPHTFAPSRR